MNLGLNAQKYWKICLNVVTHRNAGGECTPKQNRILSTNHPKLLVLLELGCRICHGVHGAVCHWTQKEI